VRGADPHGFDDDNGGVGCEEDSTTSPVEEQLEPEPEEPQSELERLLEEREEQEVEEATCLAWSQLAEIQTPTVVTTDFIYLRFTGDRSIPEEEFGRIQKDRDKEMQYWAGIINKLSKEKKLKSGFVPANNHYAGFGPATANMFGWFYLHCHQLSGKR
jgi:uncharacterized protein YecE (DUF72 family)